MTYDISRPPQQRVVSALVRCGDCVVPKYYPLDHNKVYDVLVPSFIADGGDNYSMLKAVKERKVLCKFLWVYLILSKRLNKLKRTIISKFSMV